MSERELTRRELVAAGAAAGAGGVLLGPLGGVPGWARRRPPGLLRRGSFPAGVMAGRPKERGALLWTQLGAGERAGNLRLEIARDPGFRRVVHERTVAARAEADGVALARVFDRRLKAGAEYFYRFRTRTTSSPAGRFVTARPAGSREPVRIGFFSCQDYGSGFYTAHAGLAREECDLIVCLGDYIYENNGEGAVGDRDDRTSAAESGECELVGEYRAKYRLYRSDADLRAMHSSAPFVPSWDDHEVEDNYAGVNGGKTADRPPPRRIPFLERRRNAYRVFFEQMPVVRFAGEPDRLYRRISLGGMVDLFVLDLRQVRSDQTCGDVPAIPCPEPTDPDHTLLGRAQMRWLKDGLAASRAAWKVLASSVELMSWDILPGRPLNRDGWDGYPADRRELGEHVLARGIRDVTVITGDVHHFATGLVTTNGRADGRPWATEFVGGSITSAPAVPGTFAEQSLRTNPHMIYQEFDRRGYGVLEARPDGVTVRYRSPASIERRPSPTETIAEFRVPRGEPRVVRA